MEVGPVPFPSALEASVVMWGEGGRQPELLGSSPAAPHGCLGAGSG